MDIAWIQVFLLTFSECVAPAGKTVCQEQQFELQFLSKPDCEYALQQLIAMKDEADNVIVNRQSSGCAPSAAQVETYEDVVAVTAVHGDADGWRNPRATEARRQVVNSDHRARLDELSSCEETNGVAPCRVGDIIVEETGGDNVDVWKRD